jgi:hypothetical protein
VRCSCPHCAAYMIHREKGIDSACVCPDCLHTCNACMGSGEPVGRGQEMPAYLRLRYDRAEEGGEE